MRIRLPGMSPRACRGAPTLQIRGYFQYKHLPSSLKVLRQAQDDIYFLWLKLSFTQRDLFSSFGRFSAIAVIFSSSAWSR